ncbi:uncharacterized protein LOC132612418 [Lycium barbarum]|uniref:uncharacterized protein LOC132612418 n=1 Tax=Lycium barbarum TaxID=112863 RepID=UPI00293F658B|nr:uncharacterized protein LOC132612418 [Lycium barbarum]
MMKNGIMLVRFDSEEGKNKVVQAGVYHFNNKPFIVKAWLPNMEFIREELHSVPIWIKLPGLDFKYWSPRGLSKIGSLIGKPLMVGKQTERKLGLNFARLLVEVKVGEEFPDKVLFRNEKGNVVTQRVIYDWRPSICAHCHKYGHESDSCRKNKKTEHVALAQAPEKKDEEVETVQMIHKKAAPAKRNGSKVTGVDGNTGGQAQNTKHHHQNRAKKYKGATISSAARKESVRMSNTFKPLQTSTNDKHQQQETKIKVNRIKWMAEKMFGGWEYCANHSSHYNGRIWMVWKGDTYKVTQCSENAQAITCQVLYIPLQVQYLVTFFYSYNTREQMKELWEYICQVHDNNTMAWMILGYFNSVLHSEDRIGGNVVTLSEVVDFQHCLDHCGFTELPRTGCNYTWHDKGDASRAFSKLDRVLVNGEWMDKMESCKVQFLPEGISDHSPVYV